MSSDAMASLALLVCVVPVYFLPSLIAIGRKGAGWVFVVNLLLGWTAIAWLGALIWALGSKKPEARKDEVFYVAEPDGTFRRVQR